MDEWRDWRTNAPKHLGDVWRLTKGRRVAACVLVGHPIGCELRVLVDEDLRRSEAFKNGVEAVVVADDWRGQFEAKGWRATQ